MDWLLRMLGSVGKRAAAVMRTAEQISAPKSRGLKEGRKEGRKLTPNL